MNMARLEAAEISTGSPLRAEDLIFYDLNNAEYKYTVTEKNLGLSGNHCSYGGAVRTARNSETNISSFDQILEAYGQPNRQGTVTRDSWYYRLEHDFEGEESEECRQEADSHLDQTFLEYTFEDSGELWGLYFVFDDKDTLVLQGVTTHKQLF